MKNIFVNFKRFEVPRSMGGVCPLENPDLWIKQIMYESVELGIGELSDMQVVYMLPESLIIPAIQVIEAVPSDRRRTIQIGCQSVFREDIKPGGNFGAFTTNLPAAAARNMGCTWTIIGHSEERHDKQGIIGTFAPEWDSDDNIRSQVIDAVNSLLNNQVICALKQDLDVLFCIGETAEERDNGDFNEQKKRIEKVLLNQLKNGLHGIEGFSRKNIVIGYEPIWAIGPGKTPPDREYIAFVSELIKKIGNELFGRELPVVYGGGLKKENAAMISGIGTIDGGLVALTRFSGEIGFYINDFMAIIEEYIGTC